jgi:hypothetical protein
MGNNGRNHNARSFAVLKLIACMFNKRWSKFASCVYLK